MVRGVAALDTPETGDGDFKSSPEYADRLRKVFATHLRRLLRQKGWSQSELERRAKALVPDGASATITRDGISRYCRGEHLPNPERFDLIARALNVKTADLLPPAEMLREDEYNALHSANRWVVQMTSNGNNCSLVIQADDLPFEVGVKVVEMLRTYAPPDVGQDSED